MKVLYLTYSPSPYRVDFFTEFGKYVDLTVCYEIMPIHDKEKNMRNIDWYGTNSKNYISIYLKNIYFFEKYISLDVIKLIKKEKYDIIVIGGYSSLTAMVTMEYLKLKKIPFILNIDGGFPNENENKIKILLKKHFICMSDHYLSSGKNGNKYLKYYGAKEENIYVYPFTSMKQKDILNNKISIEEKERLRKKLNMENKITFISIGRFIPIKGFDLLIEASKNLSIDSKILIIGDQPTEEYLNLIKKLKIDNVEFIDFKPKEELVNYLKASDVFVLPTRGDIWGLVVNEALSVGIPVITTKRCGAGLDLIKDNYNGFIIDQNNIEQLHNKMKYFIDNRNIINEMSINAIKSVKNYTIENEAKVHYKIFTEILKKRKK